MANVKAHPTGSDLDGTTLDAIDDILEFQDRDTSRGSEVLTSFNVPASLQKRIAKALPGTLPTMTVGGSSVTVETSGSATTTSVVYNQTTGLVTFDSSHSGSDCVVTITPVYHIIPGEVLEYIQGVAQKNREFIRTQGALYTSVYFPGYLNAAAASSADAIPLVVPGDSDKKYKLLKLSIAMCTNADVSTGTGSTTFRIAEAYSGTPTNYYEQTLATTADATAMATGSSLENGTVEIQGGTIARAWVSDVKTAGYHSAVMIHTYWYQSGVV